MSKKLYHTFISDVISGKKLSCKFVKQSVDRHVNDLKKKDFDYKFAYDPIGGNTSKSYTFENYDGDSVTIKQLEEVSGTIVEDISPIPNEVLNITYPYVTKKVENGFYPKVINELYYYFTKKDIFYIFYVPSIAIYSNTGKPSSRASDLRCNLKIWCRRGR